MEWKPHISLKSIIIKNISLLSNSQTLYFLSKVRRPRVIKYKLQEIYWPPAQGVVVGEEENRRSVGTSLGATETCFSQEKQITIGWMVIILSSSCQWLITLASCEQIEDLSLSRSANRDTFYCNSHWKRRRLVNLGWSHTTSLCCIDHVDHNYLSYRSVDYDDCLAQFSSKEKEEERQAVLGLLEQKDVETVLPTGFAKSLI